MKNPLGNMKKTSLKSPHYGAKLRPSRDWLLLLSVALLLLLLSLAWNLWTFKKVTEGEPLEATVPPPAKKAPLEAVTKIFDKRALEEARYLNEYRFVDPSPGSR